MGDDRHRSDIEHDTGEAFSWDDGPLGRPERPDGLSAAGAPAGRRADVSAAARGASRPGRRLATAGGVLVAMLLGFFVASLLDATTLEREFKGMPLGCGRSLGLAALRPVTALSGAVGLDRPAKAIDEALGRTGGPHHTLAQARKTKALWPREITSERPLKLYIAGDSMARTFGQSLINLSEETGLVKASLDYHVSSGLSRPDYFDWPQRFIDTLVEKRPDAVVALFGANDAQDVAYKGQVLEVGTMAWRSLYQKRVGEAMDILTSGGRRVYWVGSPIMRDKLYRERISMMDHIYAEQSKTHPGVTYISTWALMANGKGSYAETLEGSDGAPVLMREPDGIHLTRAGGDRMAGAVLKVIARDWGFEY